MWYSLDEYGGALGESKTIVSNPVCRGDVEMRSPQLAAFFIQAFMQCRPLCFVQVFGRRDDDTIHALLRPASKKRQSTKSREVGHRRCRGRYGDFAAVRDLSAG